MQQNNPPARGARLANRGLFAALLVAPLLGAALLRPSAGDSRVTGLLLLGEPLLVGLLLYGLALLLAKRRWLPAGALFVGLSASLLVLHAPAEATAPIALDLPWQGEAARCAQEAAPPSAPLRVLTWNTAGESLDEATLARIVELRPDVAVLTALPDTELIDRLAQVAPGESLGFGVAGELIGIYVKGSFSECAGHTAAWPFSLPDLAATGQAGAGQDRQGAEQLVLALPHVPGVGTFPLLAFQVPFKGAPSSWPGSVQQGAEAMAAVAILAGGSTVAAGHLGAPSTFHRATGALRGAGLQDAGGPANWPNRVLNMPFLPIHKLDRVLTGRHWSAAQAAGGASAGSYRPLLVQLSVDAIAPPMGTN